MRLAKYIRLTEATGLYAAIESIVIADPKVAKTIVEIELPDGIGKGCQFLIDLEACASIRSEVDNNVGQKDFWEKGKVDIEMRVEVRGHNTLHEIFARYLGAGNKMPIMLKRLGIYRNATLLRSKFTEFDGRMVSGKALIPTHLRMVMWLDISSYAEGH